MIASPGGPELPVVQLEDLIGLKVQALVNDHEREQQELVDTCMLLKLLSPLAPVRRQPS